MLLSFGGETARLSFDPVIFPGAGLLEHAGNNKKRNTQYLVSLRELLQTELSSIKGLLNLKQMYTMA